MSAKKKAPAKRRGRGRKATLTEHGQPKSKRGRKPAANKVPKGHVVPGKRGRPAKQRGSNGGTADVAGGTAIAEPASPSWGGLRHYGRKLMNLTPPSSVKKWGRGAMAVGSPVALAGWDKTPGAASTGFDQLSLHERTAGSPSGILGIQLEFLPSP